jgi:predicted O-methyltransferase YrrM
MNNPIGHFYYGGIPAAQHMGVIDAFTVLLKAVKPRQILEIGTSAGGLTVIIRDVLDWVGLFDTRIRTYDIPAGYYDRQHFDQMLNRGMRVESYLKNIFTDDFLDLLPEEKPGTTSFIQSPGRTLIICDGGHKPQEFNIFADLMKPGDIIMAHDYAPNAQVFEAEVKGKIWNWMEIQDSDIQQAVERNNLIPVFSHLFHNVAWTCQLKL